MPTISIITANFYPEDTAIGLYTSQFANQLKKDGYVVQVITGFPYYPQWKIHDNYANKPRFFQEKINGVDVFRYKQFVPKKATFFTRILMMLSLFFGSIVNLKKIKHTDLIICIVPFTISIIPGILLSKYSRAKLWVHIQDLEFDLAFEAGIIGKNNVLTAFLKKIIYWLETKLLNPADTISSISYKMLEKIKTKTKNKNLFYFPNWVSQENINPNTSLQHDLVNKDKFTMLYSGNIGEKQDWHLLQRLCNLIKDADAIEIIVVGDGSYKVNLMLILSHYNFVKFYPPVPYKDLNDLLCSVNIHFLFQKNNVLDTIMPSKILGMMASGRPSIITGNLISEVNTVIKESNGGYYFSQNNPENEIYKTLLELKNNPANNEMGRKARKYIVNKFSEEAILSNVKLKIKTILKE